MDQRVTDLKMAQAAQWIKEQSASGLSKSKWCEVNGINRITFFRYQRKFREMALDNNPQVEQAAREIVSSPVFVELPIQSMTDNTEDNSPKENAAAHATRTIVTFRCGPFSAEVPDDLSEHAMNRILQAMKNAQ